MFRCGSGFSRCLAQLLQRRSRQIWRVFHTQKMHWWTFDAPAHLSAGFGRKLWTGFQVSLISGERRIVHPIASVFWKRVASGAAGIGSSAKQQRLHEKNTAIVAAQGSTIPILLLPCQLRKRSERLGPMFPLTSCVCVCVCVCVSSTNNKTNLIFLLAYRLLSSLGHQYTAWTLAHSSLAPFLEHHFWKICSALRWWLSFICNVPDKQPGYLFLNHWDRLQRLRIHSHPYALVIYLLLFWFFCQRPVN